VPKNRSLKAEILVILAIKLALIASIKVYFFPAPPEGQPPSWLQPAESITDSQYPTPLEKP